MKPFHLTLHIKFLISFVFILCFQSHLNFRNILIADGLAELRLCFPQRVFIISTSINFRFLSIGVTIVELILFEAKSAVLT